MRVELTIVVIPDDELLQVTARPTYRPEQHDVHAVQTDCRRDREAPPDGRLYADQLEPQLVDEHRDLHDAQWRLARGNHRQAQHPCTRESSHLSG